MTFEQFYETYATHRKDYPPMMAAWITITPDAMTKPLGVFDAFRRLIEAEHKKRSGRGQPDEADLLAIITERLRQTSAGKWL